ncbi:Crp/Fnr family transcriptional regulator [Sporolituus thermophilus]|uniref:CRP/FNR family transcriptional regulator, anaerobic regulatory protein n=1 Tax=Sporolituus thermophilus DSM 23256 TaxID=1123285 RepID=A0A1G7MXM9_9FIRM|nr:Crp/Fnr family transcriptional regulator [Sporolituus thermophilus]SDF66437.1 CRP/FNR family transcriptional regulator, anaerobic regulatory protein [Sporolituus thermophilus DSM 23256]
MDSIEHLKKLPIFADLSDRQLAEIHNLTTERLYRKGMVIFMEGEPGEGFHFVKSGKVKIVKMTDDGREHIIHILGPGDLFAEVLLFNNRPYPATAIAAEDARVGIIKNTELERLVLNNNRLALQLIKALSQRLLYAQQKIKNLALNDVTARTAETLLRLGKQHGRRTARGIEVDLGLSRQDLASLVGTTRETVTRTLSALKKDRLIDFDGDILILLQPEKLARLIQ